MTELEGIREQIRSYLTDRRFETERRKYLDRLRSEAQWCVKTKYRDRLRAELQSKMQCPES
jgi:hypothetical protein